MIFASVYKIQDREMLKVIESISNYVLVLEKYQKESPLYRAKSEESLASVARLFCQILDIAEQNPVFFETKLENHLLQRRYYEVHLKAAKAIDNILSGLKSPLILPQLNLLVQRVEGLRYRIEGVNGGLDKTSIDSKVLSEITLLAHAWKAKQMLYSEAEKKLNRRDLAKLKQACAYPEFCKLLCKDTDLQERFFNWAIRDNNGVNQFIEFPATTARVNEVFLGERVGKFGGELLAIHKRKVGSSELEKVLTLPFNTIHEVRHISILNESLPVMLNGGWRLSIGEIFNIFSKKHTEFTDLEFFGPSGITNWHAFELGPWNPVTKTYDHVDISSPDWWKKLPVFEEVSQEELEGRCGEKLAKGEWLACISAGRTAPDHRFEDRHTYLLVAIPAENGKYRIYPFGQYPEKFPVKLGEQVEFLAKYVKAKIAYPDHNYLISERQHAIHPIKPDEEERVKLINKVAQDILRARKGELTFQLVDENCARWAQTTVHEAVDRHRPNFFKIEIGKMTSVNPILAKIFAFLGRLSILNQNRLFKGLLKLVGGGRGTTVIEDGKPVYKVLVKDSAVPEQIYIFQPGFLHQQIEEGKLKGRIIYGH